MVRLSILVPLFVSVFLWWGALSSEAFCQTSADTLETATIDRAIDELLQFVDQEDGDRLLERLLYLHDNPVDVQESSAGEIGSLPTLSRLQAARLVQARSDSESPLSPEQVRDALQLSSTHFAAIRPFLLFGADGAESPDRRFLLLDSWRVEWMQRYTRRLDIGRGYFEENGERAYKGSPERHYTRLRARHPHAQINLTLDKAAGEPFSWDPGRRDLLFPHHSAYIQLNDLGPVESLVLGDYSAGFGEGLTLAPVRMTGHGRDPFAPAASSGGGIRPSGSSMRNQAFRGMAATVDVTNRVSITGFWSGTDRDATVDTLHSDVGYTLQTTGPSASGYYRTATERARKARLPEYTTGGAAIYSTRRWELGMVGYLTRYGADIVLPDFPHRSQQFQGDSARMLGVFGNNHTRWGTLFWELAHAPSGSFGATGGFQTDLSRFASVLTSFRYLPADFDGIHGSTFTAVGGTPQNEYGWYTGLRVRPHQHWTIDAYVDHQRYPWLRHHFSLPSTGFDSRLTINYEPYRWLSGFVEYRYRSRDERHEHVDTDGRKVIGITPRHLHSVRAQMSYQFSSSLRVQLRADARSTNQADEPPEHGTLLYADLRMSPCSWLRMDQRITFFSADSYAARLYAYESDLLYAFSLPALHRTGQRAYIMATAQLSSTLYFQVKYAETRYEHAASFGSGWDEVEGSRLRELRAQVRLRF